MEREVRDRRSFRAEDVQQLLDTQRKAIRLILERIARIIVRSLELGDDEERKEAASRQNPNTLHLIRPHQVFCIDGSRGSGKTFTLATVQHAIEQLKEHLKPEGADRRLRPSWSTFFTEMKLDDELATKLKFLAQNSGKSLAQVFRIVFPSDQESAESLMAAIFSEMRNRLPKASAAELVNTIGELEKGFHAARQMSDILSPDGREPDMGTLDTKTIEFNRIAYNRMMRWRVAVREYLAHFHAATLIILVDDSDVQPELTQDILSALRNYLTHPRIITVLAGNIRAMRNAMLQLSMRRIARAIPALGTKTNRTARDWRRFERKTVEEYIDKVLPPAQRFFLGPPEFHVTRPGETESDFAKIAGRELLGICEERLSDTREPFLRAKYLLALRREVELEDQPNEAQQGAIEAYLSWWMFGNHYAAELAPRSARQIVTFRDYYGDIPHNTDGDIIADAKPRSVKRLPVMLHDVSDNFTLIQRLDDTDVSVTAWLREQQLESSWLGQRMFHINSIETFQGSYTYDYLRFRMDVALAAPVRDNPDEALARGLLPKFRGRRFMRRFFLPQNMNPQQRRYGVSQRIDHAAVPANCLYFYDLAAIPDVSIFANDEEAKGSVPEGMWEAQLAGRWPEYVDADGGTSLIRYFTEILCERLRHTERITSATLMLELDPPKDKGKRGLYDAAVSTELVSFAEDWSDVWTRARDELTPDAGAPPHLDALKSADSPGSHIVLSDERPAREKIAQAKHLLARYMAMLTDLRRAWHAVRIHQHAPKHMEAGVGITARGYERASRAVIANQSRMSFYTLQDLRLILWKSEWTKAILEFTKWSAIRPQWEAATKQTGEPAGMRLRFLFDVDAPIKLEVGEEAGDWKNWALTLRRVGRGLSADWPAYDDSDECLTTVGLDAREPWRLPIAKASLRESELARGREARAFLFLVYGLAPSLPAVIHTNVMARVYELSPGATAADQRVITAKIYDSLKGELEEWGDLIGSLAVAIRYVKIQSLRLFAKLFLNNALDNVDDDQRTTATKKELRERFAAECFPQLNTGFSLEVFKSLQARFGANVATELALMPDVAPSSLFGERWMQDLVVTTTLRNHVVEDLAKAHLRQAEQLKLSLKASKDDAREIKGIFGETELWLWTANRCLCKLNNVLRNAAGIAFEGAPRQR
jgi:hypothetical protein